MKKIKIEYNLFEEYDKVYKKNYEKIRFVIPNQKDVIVEITGSQEYYPEEKMTYGYPSNIDDRVVYDLGEDTYDFEGISCIYDMPKIKFRRALVRAYANQENCEWGEIEISEKYLKESK